VHQMVMAGLQAEQVDNISTATTTGWLPALQYTLLPSITCRVDDAANQRCATAQVWRVTAANQRFTLIQMP
jgi:hypothetical protein